MSDQVDAPGLFDGEDLWFNNRYDFEEAMASSEWETMVNGRFATSVGGIYRDLFNVEDEYRSNRGSERIDPNIYLLTRGAWQIPNGESLNEIEEYYFTVHVPNLRRLPSVRRHAILKGLPWPDGHRQPYWRGADCWKDMRYLSADSEAGADDKFGSMVADLRFDRFIVQEEWISLV